jgi:TRAP-type C4-dicarboxylate transport system permease small subunit
MRPPPRDIMRAACHVWDAIEKGILAALTLGMVLLAVAQVVLRNIFKTGLVWAEPLLGMLLLWLTMWGALAATDARRHININVAEQLFPPHFAAVFVLITNLFAAAVCGLLSVAGFRFCEIQREIEPTKLLGVPTWIYLLVIPVCLTLMSYRFVLHSAAGWVRRRKGRGGREAAAPVPPFPGDGA